MKKDVLLRFGLALLVAGFVFSCKPDSKDEDPTTPTDPKSRFIGSWTCSEHSYTDNTNSSYTIHIVDSTGSWVLIESFYNQGFNRKAKATISGDDMSIVTPQNVNGLFIKRFTGHMSNSTSINMTYVMDDGSSLDSCSATLSKQ